MAYLRCDECGASTTHQGSWDTPITILCEKCSKLKNNTSITQDVIEYEEEQAIVDNTNIMDRKVILTDEEKPYIQRFFLETDDLNLIERCKLMRMLKISSL